MNDTPNQNIGKEVDSLAKELHEEFFQHVAECQQANAEMTDSDIIFRSWAIQKIAELHAATLNLEKRLVALEWSKRKR